MRPDGTDSTKLIEAASVRQECTRQRLDVRGNVARLLVVVLAVFTAVTLWGDDPWKKKSYKEWDEKDIGRILNDSPWAKTIEAEREEKKRGLEAPAGAPTVGNAREEDEDEESEQDKKHRGRKEEDEEKGKEKGSAEAKFIVRWISSRTLREASVRGQVLRKQISETDTDKQLPPAPDDYELAVVGTDMTSFQHADEPTLKRGTNLIGKKSKEKITASQVEIVRGPDGKRINAIIFHFPKTNSAGQAIVPPDEKEVKFVTYAGSIEIKAIFNPQKMIDKQGMDL
jgi:hypothetical protein